MKNNKKIVLALGTAGLGLVAATGVTSGFAWFAANANVSVSNLNVSAKATQSFLLIGDGTKTYQQLQSAPTTSIDKNAVPATELEPSMWKPSVTTVNSTNANAYTTWQTATSDSLSSSAKSETGNYADIAEADYDKYILKYTFTVGLAAESSDIAGLEISSVTLPKWNKPNNPSNLEEGTTPTSTGISVVITADFVKPTPDGTHTGWNFTSDSDEAKTLVNTTITKTDVVAINAYVYINGEDAEVFTNNKANITGGVSFELHTKTANA